LSSLKALKARLINSRQPHALPLYRTLHFGPGCGRGRNDIMKISIQTELENVRDVRELGVEGIFRIVKVLPMSMKVLGFVHNQESVPVLPTLANPSWHLARVTAYKFIFRSQNS
jgi:hypothetical protein